MRAVAFGAQARARGFTLIEAMIVLVIAAILLVIGIPSFRDASVGSRLRDIANDLNASVQVARSEAIKRNVPVTLCRSTDGATCDDADDWGQGWIVLEGAEIIQYQQPVATGYKVERTSSPMATSCSSRSAWAPPLLNLRRVPRRSARLNRSAWSG